jgi:hypothetical protein
MPCNKEKDCSGSVVSSGKGWTAGEWIELRAYETQKRARPKRPSGLVLAVFATGLYSAAALHICIPGMILEEKNKKKFEGA